MARAQREMAPALQALRASRAVTTYTVPVHFHVIIGGTATRPVGNVTDAMINAQLAVINRVYAPYFQFSLQVGCACVCHACAHARLHASVCWGGHVVPAAAAATLRRCSQSVKRRFAPTWFAMSPGAASEANAKAAMRAGGMRALNIYTAGLTGGLLGWAYFPGELGSRNALHPCLCVCVCACVGVCACVHAVLVLSLPPLARGASHDAWLSDGVAPATNSTKHTPCPAAAGTVNLQTDGVVVLHSSLPGGATAYYNHGHTVTHEVGSACACKAGGGGGGGAAGRVRAGLSCTRAGCAVRSMCSCRACIVHAPLAPHPLLSRVCACPGRALAQPVPHVPGRLQVARGLRQ
jgi:hypothetical protein